MLIFGAVGSLLMTAGLLLPGHLGPIYRAWMGFGLLLSRVTTPIFMAVVYFGVIAPVGLLMRLLGRNPIRHRPIEGSYWAARDGARGTLKNQF